MKKIITSLGTYCSGKKAKYQFNDNTYEGYFFANVLLQFESFDKMYVLVTEEARKTTWPYVEREDDSCIEAVGIPEGNTTEELWSLFQILLDNVDDGDELIFDITHGLRAIPFIIFLFLAFLKTAKDVKIASVYYAQFNKSGNESGGVNLVVDLSEFVEMLDWITAAHTFISTGAGLELAELLYRKVPANEELASDKSLWPVKRNLKHTVDAISNLSDALIMARPFEVLKTSKKVEETLSKSGLEVAKLVPQFGVLLKPVSDTYSQFKLANESDPHEVLIQQWKLIDWYISHRQFNNAVLLMREWIVSYTMVKNSKTELIDRNLREEFEYLLNKKAHSPIQDEGGLAEAFTKPIVIDSDLSELFQNLGQLRNDLAHLGHRKKGLSTKNIVELANEYFAKLEKFKEKT